MLYSHLESHTKVTYMWNENSFFLLLHLLLLWTHLEVPCNSHDTHDLTYQNSTK